MEGGAELPQWPSQGRRMMWVARSRGLERVLETMHPISFRFWNVAVDGARGNKPHNPQDWGSLCCELTYRALYYSFWIDGLHAVPPVGSSGMLWSCCSYWKFQRFLSDLLEI